MKHCALVLTITVAAVAGAAQIGTDFTYQGILSAGGVPANGSFDLRFILYNADSGGSQVGTTQYVADLDVSQGRVNAVLDFGAVFDGTALWLEVSVRDGASTGAYTVLSPRQALNAGPYSQHALEATHALTADSAATAANADQLDGQHGAYYLAWSNFTGVPAGLDDGDDDTLAGLSCSDGQIARWTGSAWNCSTDDDTPYVRTYVVGPVGTAVENGTALLAALAAIPTPASQEEAALLKLEPGLYDVGMTAVTMKPWVDVEGSGETVTKITGAVCGSTTGVVEAASNSELRRLAVESTCAGTFAYGIYIAAPGARLRRLVVSASSGASTASGVLVQSGADWTAIRELTATTSATTNAYGAFVIGDACSLEDVTLWGGGGSNANNGLQLNGAEGFEGRDITASASGSNAISIYCMECDGKIVGGRAWGAATAVRAAAPATSHALTLEGFTATGSAYGLYATGAQLTLTVNRSSLSGSTNSVYLTTPVVYVAASQLSGGPVSAGAILCAGVWDESLTFYPSTCP